MNKEHECDCGKIHSIDISDFDIHKAKSNESSFYGFNNPLKKIICECGRVIVAEARVEVSVYDRPRMKNE